MNDTRFVLVNTLDFNLYLSASKLIQQNVAKNERSSDVFAR